MNFFLIQKGYPEIVIRIEDRDIYYNSLISADKGLIEPLIEFIAKNIRLSVDKIEEFKKLREKQLNPPKESFLVEGCLVPIGGFAFLYLIYKLLTSLSNN